MGFHLLAYAEAAVAAGATDTDITAAGADQFSRRNDHYIFSERYRILASSVMGASITRARLNMPTLNALARDQLWPIERSATVPDLPQFMDLRHDPLEVPLAEELAVETTNDLAMGTEDHTIFFWLAPPSWNRNLPHGDRIQVRATGAVAGTAMAWSVRGAITFAENLRGGWYSVVGANCFDAGVRAFRLFPFQYRDDYGRQLIPGGLAQEAIGNSPLALNRFELGEWFRFHSFEPPEIQILANATGASTQEIRLDLVYLGRDQGYPR